MRHHMSHDEKHPAQDFHGHIHDHLKQEHSRHAEHLEHARKMHHMGEEKHHKK